jgi:octaprenyl-diphosphate synthase
MTQLALSRAVLDRLAHVSSARGAPSLSERLVSLDRWVRADLVAFEAEIAALPRGARVVHAAAHHLLDLRGKHLRPLCVALTSRFGDGFTDQARGLAVAVELVHNATLLHDDVVDVAERRRGEPAACFGHRIAPLVGSRGCYANCTFCCIAAWHEQSLPGKRDPKDIPILNN